VAPKWRGRFNVRPTQSIAKDTGNFPVKGQPSVRSKEDPFEKHACVTVEDIGGEIRRRRPQLKAGDGPANAIGYAAHKVRVPHILVQGIARSLPIADELATLQNRLHVQWTHVFRVITAAG
jgi:hypothetical protein